MSVIVKGGQTLAVDNAQILSKGPSVVPTSLGNLATVTGNVLITGIYGVVLTAITATATTLNVGTAASATSLINAEAVTSLAVGQVVTSNETTPVTPAAPVVAAAGHITWQASASNTGAIKFYICYVPLDPGAGIS